MFPLPWKKDNKQWKKIFISTQPWDMEHFSSGKIISSHTSGVTSLCLDENYLFSGSHDNSIHLHSIHNDSFTPIGVLTGHEYTIWALISDGKKLYSGSNDHTIRVWNLDNNNNEEGDGEEEKDNHNVNGKYLKMSPERVLREHNSKIFSLKIKDNLLFSSGDKFIKVWDREKYVVRTTMEGHTGGINTISVQDHWLISGASDKTFRLWDLHTLKCVHEQEEKARVLSIAAAMSNNLIFTGLQNCAIQMWDTRTSSPVHTFVGHQWEVWQLALAGGYLMSGSFDHKIKVWDLRGKCVRRTLQGHRSFIHALAADAKRLYSASADKLIQIWGMDGLTK